MKRETLFRGKDIETGKWIEGGVFASESKTKPEFSRAFIVCGMVDFKGIMIEVAPKSVSQFTGLIDKNGKKIFENDIVHHGDSSELCFVSYKESGFYCMPLSKERHVLPLEMWLSGCVLIGNVFDNPELVAKNA